jgi:hypothetical protein
MRLVLDEQRPAFAFSGFFPARGRLFYQVGAHGKITIRCAMAFRALEPVCLPSPAANYSWWLSPGTIRPG